MISFRRDNKKTFVVGLLLLRQPHGTPWRPKERMLWRRRGRKKGSVTSERPSEEWTSPSNLQLEEWTSPDVLTNKPTVVDVVHEENQLVRRRVQS